MRPHDLLRLKPGAVLHGVDAPVWVGEAIHAAPCVVVRRGERRNDGVPVGVRGQTRAQRYAAMLDVNDVEAIVTPEALAIAAAWRTWPRRAMPAFAALDLVAQAAEQSELIWGPGGSAGFELASTWPVVHAESDLDVIVRPTTLTSHDDLARFACTVDAFEVHVDVILESAQGAVALREWLQSPQRTLIKTDTGAQLGVFQW